MGKGDKKSKKGKIIAGSFGKKRPHKKKAAKQLQSETSNQPNE